MAKNIHDKTFAQLLSERDFLISFLKTYLPLDVQEKISWDSLKLYKMGGHHVQEKTLNLSIADVIYLANIEGKEGMLWVHFEHQTTPDRLMLLRAINYQTSELLAYAKANKKKILPPIISLIYYQGKKPYPYNLELSSLFDNLGLQYFAKPILIDLPSIPDRELRHHGEVGIIELLLKYIRRKDFVKRYRAIISGLQQVNERCRRVMVKYLIERAPLSEEILVKTLIEYLPQEEETMLTVGEQLIQKGRLQGIEQGMEKGMHAAKLQVAKALLQKGLSATEISQITELSEAEIISLQIAIVD